MRYKSFLAVMFTVMLILVPLSGQAGSFNIGTDTILRRPEQHRLEPGGRQPARLGDVNPGDGLCATAMATCTLRAAIEESYAYEGPADSITLPADTYVISSSLIV